MQWQLLSPLSDDERDVVIATARRRTFAKNEVVFNEGDPSESVHLVVAGHFAARVSTPGGDRATHNVIGPGGWFGELSLLRDQDKTVRSATVLALDSSTTLVLARAAFHELCDRYPRIERLVAALMAARIRELDGQLLQARYASLDSRLCKRLLDLAAVFDGDNVPATIPLTQDHLSDMVGGTRPSVNQVLQRLAAEGVIEIGRGRIVILDRSDLARRVDG